MLPNFVYSVALAHYMLANSVNLIDSANTSIDEVNELEKAEKCFEFAISRFTFMIGQILDKLQIKADSAVENCYSLSTLAFYKYIMINNKTNNSVSILENRRVCVYLLIFIYIIHMNFGRCQTFCHGLNQ